MENIERPAKDSVYFITTKEFFCESNWSNFIALNMKQIHLPSCQKGTSDENRWTVKLNFRTIIKRGAAMEA